MTWPEMCSPQQFAGHWVALDNVRYDPTTSLPVEADLIDADEDLADLCARMREADRHACAILFCDDEHFVQTPRRPSQIPVAHSR